MAGRGGLPATLSPEHDLFPTAIRILGKKWARGALVEPYAPGMKHHPRRARGAWVLPELTLSDVPSGPGTSTTAPEGPREDLSAASAPQPPIAPASSSVRCQSGKCWGRADYRIPQGTTPRTQIQPLSFCVECLEQYLERLKRSLVFKGEPCEWALTLHHLENVWDGRHDYRRNLLRDRCHHSSCREARGSNELEAGPERREESA